MAQRSVPDYTQSSVVNAATGQSGALAPNTIATIYGVNLARAARALEARDIRAGLMPSTLPGTGTEIQINGVFAPLYYASPNQVNFLVPPDLKPGPIRLIVAVDGIRGRETNLFAGEAAPGVFLAAPGLAAATAADGRAITPDQPAVPEQWVIVYATGLGECRTAMVPGELARSANPLIRRLRVWLDGMAIEPAYAGLAPGYAGLYQVNFQIPTSVSANPLLRLDVEGVLSPEGVRLPVRKTE